MQAVILAGGLGTRLRPLTETVPKPLVPVAGVPYLHHQLKLLCSQGIKEIVLLTGYLGEQVQACFGDGAELGVSIRYRREASPQGTGGALRDAFDLLAARFLLLYGDSLLPIEYAPVMERLEESGADCVVAAYRDSKRETGVSPNLALDERDRVVAYSKCEGAGSLGYIDAGVLALRRSVVGLVAKGRPASLEQEVFPTLISAGRLAGLPVGQRFYDIGTPERLAVLEEFLRP